MMSTIDLRSIALERALTHDYSKGPLLLLAGPGTGKTFSLFETIKYQCELGYSLTGLFEATLTNAAVEDFLREAKAQLAPDFDSSSTLHFRAKGILHKHAAEVGIDPDFTIVDPNCEQVITQDLSNILNKRITEIGDLLQSYRRSSALLATQDTDFAPTYRRLQSFYSAIDWFDVVSRVCKLMITNPTIRDLESKRFTFLLIDEYQDLNPADQMFVEQLLNGRHTLLAVGDDDQSVYSGRFANPEGIVHFKSRYPTAKLMGLPVTSRLPIFVVSASNNLISLNNNRYPKDPLITIADINERADKGFVISVNNKSSKAEREFLSVAIQMLLTNGTSPSEILVLCNCRELGIELVDWLRREANEIPILNYLDKPDNIDSSRYMINQVSLFLENPNKNLPIRVLLQELFASEAGTASYIASYAFNKSSTIWESVNEGRLPRSIDCLKKQFLKLKRAYNIAQYQKKHEDRLREFLVQLPALSHLIDFIPDSGRKTLNEVSSNGVEPKSHYIKFLTMHSSKGLDADFVFIPFMEDSIGLPAKDKEEQRRLFYVALTRAKVGVVLSWAWSRRSESRFKCSGTGGNVIKRNPSPFIAECGVSPNLVERGDKRTSAEIALDILKHHSQVVKAHS